MTPTDNSMIKPTHKNIVAVCKVIRESFHDSVLVYRYGGCYGFYQILKHFFPTAQPLQEDDQHILTKIGSRYYDIKGEQFPCECGKDCPKLTSLTPTLVEYWENCSYGQRLESMLAKYKEAQT